MLEVRNLNFNYNKHFAMQDINFTADKGQFIGLIGPNGSGKTTLFKLIDCILKAGSGEILVDGNNIFNFSRREIAKLIAVVPQLSQPPEGFSVLEMVSLGRYPHLGIFQNESIQDEKIVSYAMAKVGISNIEDRDASTLSGGQYQRVIISRALAQQPRLLLLDEPVSHLDIKYQIEIMDLLLALKNERIVIATFHDLNLAGNFCDKLILLSEGRILADGTPEKVLTSENIRRVYGIDQEKMLHFKNYLLQ